MRTVFEMQLLMDRLFPGPTDSCEQAAMGSAAENVHRYACKGPIPRPRVQM